MRRICYNLQSKMIIPIEKGAENKILRTQSKPIKARGKKFIKFLRDMEETMYDANGVGIAAPQVGVNDHVALALIDNKTVIPLINAEIIEASEAMVLGEEGCLSLPGLWGKVKRHKEVTVKMENLKGEEVILKFTGFNARVMQHEIDHLNAKLYIDRAEPGTVKEA